MPHARPERVLEGLQTPHVWRGRACCPHFAPLPAPGKVPPSLDRGLFPVITDFPLNWPFPHLSVHELLCPNHIWVCWWAQFLSVIQWFECGVANWDCKYNMLKSPGTLGEEISDFGFLRLLTVCFRGWCTHSGSIPPSLHCTSEEPKAQSLALISMRVMEAQLIFKLGRTIMKFFDCWYKILSFKDYQILPLHELPLT